MSTASSPAPLPHTVEADLAVIGAGPAGSATAYYAAAAGLTTLVVDMEDLLASPRDKTCGDGLTPRATGAMAHMQASHILQGRPKIHGLKLHGFGGSITAPWPNTGRFPTRGSAIPRTQLDRALLDHAVQAGARFLGGVKAVDAVVEPRRGQPWVREIVGECRGGVPTPEGETHRDVSLQPGARLRIRAKNFVLAEGVRSQLARKIGIRWERGIVHGVAARSYVPTPRGNEPWIHSHLELRGEDGAAQPGYGWIFPLGSGMDTQSGPGVNLGCGALATATRPARVNTKKMLRTYAEGVREEWELGEPEKITSALLPMGGAVTRVAGINVAAVGDTAALVNPLNGEGIDYALESGRMLVELLADGERNPDGLTHMWPARLRREYGEAFSIARRLAIVLTMPGLLAAIGPLGMRGPWAEPVMNVAARLMGNLVTPADRDLAARTWLAAGRVAAGADRLLAADARPLFGRP